jgi:hypothetical protein
MIGRLLTAIPLVIAAVAFVVAWAWLHALADAPASSLLAPVDIATVQSIEVVERRVSDFRTVAIDLAVRLPDGRTGLVKGYRRLDTAAAAAAVLGEQIEGGTVRVRAPGDTIYRHDPDPAMLAGGMFAALIGVFMLPLGLVTMGLAGAGFIRLYRRGLALGLMGLGGLILWAGLGQGAAPLIDRIIARPLDAEIVDLPGHRVPVTGDAPADTVLFLPEPRLRLEGGGEISLHGVPGLGPGQSPALAVGDRLAVTLVGADSARLRGWSLPALAVSGIGLALVMLGAMVALAGPSRRRDLSVPIPPVRRIGG